MGFSRLRAYGSSGGPFRGDSHHGPRLRVCDSFFVERQPASSGQVEPSITHDTLDTNPRRRLEPNLETREEKLGMGHSRVASKSLLARWMHRLRVAICLPPSVLFATQPMCDVISCGSFRHPRACRHSSTGRGWRRHAVRTASHPRPGAGRGHSEGRSLRFTRYGLGDVLPAHGIREGVGRIGFVRHGGLSSDAARSLAHLPHARWQKLA